MSRLPVQERRRIERALERLEDDPRRGDLQKLKGYEDTWRLRVGEYRVFLGFDTDELIVNVYAVLHRQGAYRNPPI